MERVEFNRKLRLPFTGELMAQQIRDFEEYMMKKCGYDPTIENEFSKLVKSNEDIGNEPKEEHRNVGSWIIPKSAVQLLKSGRI